MRKGDFMVWDFIGGVEWRSAGYFFSCIWVKSNCRDDGKLEVTHPEIKTVRRVGGGMWEVFVEEMRFGARWDIRFQSSM